jgi:hypothetical protein
MASIQYPAFFYGDEEGAGNKALATGAIVLVGIGLLFVAMRGKLFGR